MSKKNNKSDQLMLFEAEEIGRITPGDLWEERGSTFIKIECVER